MACGNPETDTKSLMQSYRCCTTTEMCTASVPEYLRRRDFIKWFLIVCLQALFICSSSLRVLKSLCTVQTLKREKTGVRFSQFSLSCSQNMTTPQNNPESNQFREFKMVLLSPNCTKIETILMNFQRQSNLFLATRHLTY